MTDLIESLLTAYDAKDTSTFAGICARLHESKDERQKAAEELLQVLGENDTYRAELAVNILIITGMTRDNEWFERLIMTAEKIFSPEVLSRLAADEEQRLKSKETTARISPQLRILRSVLPALMERGGARALAFVNALETELAETPLAARIAEWKRSWN